MATMKKTAAKKTVKMPTGEKPKQLSELARRAMRETNVPSQAAYRAGVVRERMATAKNTKVAGTKTSTSYSPAPMTAAAKAKAKAAGAATAAKVKNPMGLKKMNLDKKAKKK